MVCPGDDLVTLFPERLKAAGVGRCTLQMLRLESPGFEQQGTVMWDLSLGGDGVVREPRGGERRAERRGDGTRRRRGQLGRSLDREGWAAQRAVLHDAGVDRSSEALILAVDLIRRVTILHHVWKWTSTSQCLDDECDIPRVPLVCLLGIGGRDTLVCAHGDRRP